MASHKESLFQDLKKITSPPTTSGKEATQVVIKGVHNARVSVCTDQNPSDKEGAITQLTLATNDLNSFLGSPFQIFILHLSLGEKFSMILAIFPFI
jgi:hypothetical protein